MTATTWPGHPIWPPWQKVIFRFFFIYFIIYIAPWTWIGYIPYGEYITQYYYQFKKWCVTGANANLFHVRKVLVPFNGSGDTSFGWAQLSLFLSIAVVGTIIWSLSDIKRNNYNRLSYGLRIVVRYFIIMNCFEYGISKLFAGQMPFPTLSRLATPLGDLLPMRLSWTFMGYSFSYQSFSGAMEVIAGLLLLFRRTCTFGALVAAGVFANVAMLNLSYDIPVKLFSIHLFIACLLLLAYEYERFFSFMFNKTVIPGNVYQVRFSQRWLRITRVVLKLAFILVIVILPVKDSLSWYKQSQIRKEIKPIKEGIYEVKEFVRNNDTITYSYGDSLSWQDVIFEGNGIGSIKTTDTMFWQRYRRGYFTYSTDTINNIIAFVRYNNFTGEKLPLFNLKYEMPDSNSISLSGAIRGDSVFIELKKINRHFQLTEKQFHWVSEYNR